MAPEVLAHHEYNCNMHDLYGAAVVLFILVTQHPPFIRAEPRDKYFKKIYDNHWDRFWKIHSDEMLSPSFIDLMTRMLSFSPCDRLSLKQVKEHEWYNGPVPTSEEIFNRFTKRSHHMKRKHHLAKSSNARPVPSEKLMTKFYQVEDGDELLDLAIKFAEYNKYDFEKSKEYFRAKINVDEIGEITKILVSILKKPEATERCIEFKMIEGNGYAFTKAFNDFCKFLSESN